jgi:hypothetical protein
MTRKHFKLFADYIKMSVPYQENQRMVADAVIEVARKSNPDFDEEKFLKECGLTFDVE